MTWVRRLLGDRLSGGVLAALTGYFLVLQVLMTGFACGSTVMVDPADGVQFVICHPSGGDAGHRAQAGGKAGHPAQECPCGICHMADPTLLAALPQGGDLGPAFTVEAAAPLHFAAAAERVRAPRLLGLVPDPTGPPARLA